MGPANHCPPAGCAPLSTSLREYYVLIFIQICIAADGLWYRSFTERTLKNCPVGLDSSLGLCSAHAESINPPPPLDPRPIACVAQGVFKKHANTSPEKSEATHWVQNSHNEIGPFSKFNHRSLNLLWDMIRKRCPGWS